jgi:hypothetical protein
MEGRGLRQECVRLFRRDGMGWVEFGVLRLGGEAGMRLVEMGRCLR